MKNFRMKLFEMSIRMDLEAFKKHIRNVESFLNQEVIAFEKHAAEVTAEWEDFERAEYYENLHNEYWELSKVYPSIQRKSELISIYTILENTINKICLLYQSSIENPVKIEDLEANGIIDRSKRYLEKVVLLDFPSRHNSWKEITKIQQIRNSFVHADGNVKTGNSDLIKYINQSQYLELKNNKIKILNGFSEYCLQIFENFFNELFTRMEALKDMELIETDTPI